MLYLPYPAQNTTFSRSTPADGLLFQAEFAQIYENLATLAGVWSSGVGYNVSQIIYYGNCLYLCQTAHTSTADFFADWITNGYWVAIGECPATIKKWPSASILPGWISITVSVAQTIGNAGSGATFASAAYYLLFRLLGGSLANWSALATVALPDHSGIYARGAGTHNSLTKANGSKTGGFTLLQYIIDKMFGHKHHTTAYKVSGDGVYPSGGGTVITTEGTLESSTQISDGTNGTPNGGDETAPATVIMNYVIKY